MFYLVVVQAFLDYARGDVIRDQDAIGTIVGTEHETKTVRIDASVHALS